MFNKTNRFTLIELIVVIAVLGILSAIVIPNISNMNKKAQVSAIQSNIRNVQTAVDAYYTDFNNYPTSNQPTIENPQYIDFNLLYPVYLKDFPDIVGEDYWVDSLGVVWGSQSNEVDIKVENSKLSWEAVPNSNSYKVFEIVEGKNSKKIREVNLQQEKSTSRIKSSRKDIGTLVTDKNSKIIEMDMSPEKEYLISASDELGFYTAPIGIDRNNDMDVSIPANQLSRTIYIETHASDLADWLSISKRETIYDGTKIEYEYSYSRDEGKTWSEWYQNIEDVPDSETLKIKITLTREEDRKSPVLHYLKVNYEVDGKASECDINLFKVEKYCQDFKPEYPVISDKPSAPEVYLPNGGKGSQIIESLGNIITDIIPNYDVVGGSNSTGSNSSPDIDYNISYDNGVSWVGPFSNPIYFPRKDEITKVEINYTFKEDVEVTIKDPILNVTDSSNKNDFENSKDKPVIEDNKEEKNWLLAEEIEFVQNHDEAVEWKEVITKQTFPDTEMGKLEVYLSTSNDGVNWSEELLGVNSVNQLSKSNQLKVKVQSKYLETAKIEDAPLIEQVTIKHQSIDGIIQDSNYITGGGDIIDINSSILFTTNLENLTNKDEIIWAYKNNNPKINILEERWVLNGVESSTAPNGILGVGSNNIQLHLKIEFNSKGKKSSEEQWVKVVDKTFNVIESNLDFRIYSNGNFSFALFDNDTVYGWGWNEDGSLGLNHRNPVNTPQKINSLNGLKVKSIELGYRHTYAISENGEVYSWGENDSGQLGLGNKTSYLTPQKMNFFNGKKIKKISAGAYATHILLDNGEIYGWGHNAYGQLGLGHNINQNTPQLISFFQDKKVIDIGSGDWYTLFLLENGEVYSVGNNGVGQLGLGNTTNYPTPQKITFFNNKKVSKLIVGSYYSFVIMEDDSVYAWGRNTYGDLGLGHNNPVYTPTKVDFFENNKVKDIFIGNSNFALMENGEVYGWGYNESGQLGLVNNQNQNIPQKINFFSDQKVEQILVGSYHSLVVTKEGKVYAAGRNNWGQLGFGNNIDSNIFQNIDFFTQSK